MGKYVIGFDPVNRSADSNNSAIVISKGQLSDTEMVATYHVRPSSKRKFKNEVRRAAKYYGAATNKRNKN